jgi:hypothetical protein
MNEPTLGSFDTRPESVRALANQYADRHAKLVDWYPSFFLRFRLLRRLGIEFRSVAGYLASFCLYFTIILIPALIMTAVAGHWASIPLVSWPIIATGVAALYTIGFVWIQSASDGIVSLHRALADEAELHKLMAWDRRWYNIRVHAAVGGVFALGMTAALYVLQRHVSGMRMPAGALWIGFYLSYVVAESWYPVLLLFIEAKNMSVCRFELYSLSPIDSLALKRALRGYNVAGALNILVLSLVILGFVLLLPAGSKLVIPIVVSLLLVEYLCTALGCLGPRLYIGRIVRAKKEQEMVPLRGELNGLLARLKELTEEEYEGMKRLQETHDTIRDSDENLLPLGTLAKVAGALALSTLTIVGTAFADVLLAELVRPFLP